MIERHEQAMEEGDEDASDIALGEITKLSQETNSPLDRLERQVNPWSSYVILPIFALANAGIVLSGDIIREALSSPITIGVAIALPVGNLIGITLFTWLAVRAGIGTLPNGVTWPHIVGVALLAGIGFTVSIFVAGLAYDNDVLTSEAKIGILIGSLSAGILGYSLLRALSARAKQPPPEVREVSAEAS